MQDVGNEPQQAVATQGKGDETQQVLIVQGDK
jgi:hypothetical protein